MNTTVSTFWQNRPVKVADVHPKSKRVRGGAVSPHPPLIDHAPRSVGQTGLGLKLFRIASSGMADKQFVWRLLLDSCHLGDGGDREQEATSVTAALNRTAGNEQQWAHVHDVKRACLWCECVCAMSLARRAAALSCRSGRDRQQLKFNVSKPLKVKRSGPVGAL